MAPSAEQGADVAGINGDAARIHHGESRMGPSWPRHQIRAKRRLARLIANLADPHISILRNCDRVYAKDSARKMLVNEISRGEFENRGLEDNMTSSLLLGWSILNAFNTGINTAPS